MEVRVEVRVVGAGIARLALGCFAGRRIRAIAFYVLGSIFIWGGH